MAATTAMGIIGTGMAAAEPCVLGRILECPEAPAAPPSTATTTTTIVSTTTTTVAAAPVSEPDAATRMVALVNAERSAAGVAPLAWHQDAAVIAQDWSTSMSRAGALSHNDAYFNASTLRRLAARALGENVARAPDVDTAHRLLMASDGHRANILDRRFTAVGVGAVLVDGSWWFTQDFLQAAGAERAASVRTARPRRPASRRPRLSGRRRRRPNGRGTPRWSRAGRYRSRRQPVGSSPSHCVCPPSIRRLAARR